MDRAFCFVVTMTTYGYKCDQHGEFEVNRPIGRSIERVNCPTCKQPSKRVFSPLGVIYKVGGFYSIDSGQRYESQLTAKGKEIYQKAKAKAEA